MSLTALEKQIYNAYLIASRTSKNKPFKLRQNFNNIDDKTYVILKKLSLLFQNNKNVSIEEFLKAPFVYYADTNYLDLQFFTTPKAIKCYTSYKRKLETLSPDSIENIDNCKQCCKFIMRYCVENNLTLNEYKSINSGTTPLVLQHLRDHNINFYVIHGLECDRIIRQVEPDLLEFFITDFNQLLNNTRINFQQSVKLKVVIRESFQLIEDYLLKKKKNII
jgi:hypothetical protein